MERARRHRRVSAAFAFGLLLLVCELLGRSLTHRLDVGRHVATPSYSRTDYYPFLLATVKIGVALMLAAIAWRFARALFTERAARRLLYAIGKRPRPVPRVRLELSTRGWALVFSCMSLLYLTQTNAERIQAGGMPSLAGWLHTSALPVFAVLAVVFAIVWSAVGRWLAEYESYALEAAASARRAGCEDAEAVVPRAAADTIAPRRLFGLAFESRPPPAFG